MVPSFEGPQGNADATSPTAESRYLALATNPFSRGDAERGARFFLVLSGIRALVVWAPLSPAPENTRPG
jgi:hypothetical protein